MARGSQRISRFVQCLLRVVACTLFAQSFPPLLAEELEVPQVARLVQQLGANDFHEREAADQQLAELGGAGQGPLQKALQHEDAEVRLRARDLLRRLAVSQVWGASPVDYRAHQEPLAEVLNELAKQAGTKIHLDPNDPRLLKLPVTTDFRETTFWMAVDQLCQQTGTRLRPQYHRHRASLMMFSTPPGNPPVAYAGPVRAQLTSARQAFSEQLNYVASSSEVTHTLQIGIELLWEDQFRLLACAAQPEIVRAVTDSGVQISAAGSSHRGWNVIPPSTRQVSAILRLHPAPQVAKQLDELTLQWDMIAVGDMAVYTLADLTPDATHRHEDLAVTLEAVEQRSSDRLAVTLVIARDLAIPNPHDVLLHENDVELVTAAGEVLEASTRTHRLTEEGVRLRLTFATPSASAGDYQLRIHYPRIRTQRELEITFRNIPLPAAQPA